MSEIQNLIKKYAETQKRSYLTDVIDKLKNQKKLWVAYSPITRNYHLDIFEEKPVAFIFSEEEYYNIYEEKLKAKGLTVEPYLSEASERTELFMDLYRSGFELLAIDDSQHYLIISLFDIIKKPDFSNVPEVQKPLVNPGLVVTANNFFQALKYKRPPKELRDFEEKMFIEIYNAKYLMPIDPSGFNTDPDNIVDGKIIIKDKSQLRIPLITNTEDKKFFAFFTDWIEFRKFDMQKKFSGNIITFADLKFFCTQHDGVAINPFGFNLILNENMINIIESVAKGKQNVNVQKITVEKDTKVKIGTPKVMPTEMIEAVSKCLEKHSEVKAAYLRLMLKDNEESWLLVIDFDGDKSALFGDIAKSALAYSKGKNIDFIKFDSTFGRNAAADTEPFYKV